MDISKIQKLLEDVKAGSVDINSAVEKIKRLPFEDIGFARLDHHRSLRCGFPEVIYCPGKSIEQILTIFERLAASGANVLASRADANIYENLVETGKYEGIEYEPLGKTLFYKQTEMQPCEGYIAIVSGGTSDTPVAMEAKATAEALGQRVEMVCDAGVAGLHRLLPCLETLQKANVVIAVAGMEGALASVVGGLVDCPVIAVPTSVGYGANFNGLAALLAMLNSCASGVTVVNIDNGFGAAYSASLINRKISK